MICSSLYDKLIAKKSLDKSTQRKLSKNIVLELRTLSLNWEHSFLKTVSVQFGINIRTKWWEEKS